MLHNIVIYNDILSTEKVIQTRKWNPVTFYQGNRGVGAFYLTITSTQEQQVSLFLARSKHYAFNNEIDITIIASYLLYIALCVHKHNNSFPPLCIRKI